MFFQDLDLKLKNLFFVIQGKISVILEKERKVVISKIEYIVYLYLLQHFDEIETQNKCLAMNRLLLNIDKNEIELLANRFNFTQRLCICNKKFNFSTTEFIERIKPPPNIKYWNLDEDFHVQKELYIIDLFEGYFLKPGDIIGQLLKSSIPEKKFSLLFNTDTVIGEIYEKSYSEIFPHLKVNDKFSFYKYEIINKLNPKSFKIKLSHLFQLENCKNGHDILSKDNDLQNLIFIKRGEFELKMDISLNSCLTIFQEQKGQIVIDKTILKYINTNIGK